MIVPYRTGASWLHRCSAARKFFYLLFATTVLLSTQCLSVQLIAFAVTLLGLNQAKLMTRSILSQIRGFFVMVFMIAAYRAWLEGWEAAVVSTVRMLTLIFLALGVALTTPIAQIMNLIEKLLKPLDRLAWVKSDRVALTLGLTLRMIPELNLQWKEIREAQVARGLDRNIFASIVPMMVRTLKRAQDIAEAIDSRS